MLANKQFITSAATLPETKVVVLLVDDQPMVGEAVRRILAEEQDIDFHYCATAGKAAEMALRVRPTVILQDLVMPDCSGLDLVTTYRSTPAIAETPIVVLSSKEDAAVKRDAFGAGASDYLVKLPDRIELLARIRYHSAACLNERRKNEIAVALLESEAALARHVVELQEALEERSRFRAELEAANARLERESFLDSLTELLNRRGLEHQLSVELGRAARERVPLLAVLIDCDNFKWVNDNWGHNVGDEVLQEVARRITGVVRRTDHVARVGGDEFLILLSKLEADRANELANRIRGEVADKPILTGSTTINQTVSVAVFQVPGTARSTTDVLATGSMGLHQSKQAGKNRVSSLLAS